MNFKSKAALAAVLLAGASAAAMPAAADDAAQVDELIQNAADFAVRRVRVSAMWDADRIVVRVRDDGPGFSPEIMAKLGEPYVTTRPGRTALTDEQLGEHISFPAGFQPATKSRFEMLLGAKEHEMHHRGQLMVIQRLLGITPHLTRRRQENMAARAAAAKA